MGTWKITFAVLATAAVLVGCATMDTRWQDAESQNTVSAYEAYLIRYPNSQHAASAREKLDELRWREAESKNTVAGFYRYLNQQPRGTYSAQAKERIDSLRWQEAASVDKLENYEQYIKNHPAGKHAAEANEKIEAIHWQKALSTNTVFAFQRYLKLYPQGPHSAEVPIKIEELDWATAKKQNSMESYESFIQKHPNSNFSGVAREELKRFAKVVVTLPKAIAPGKRFEIWFTESNGVGVVFKEMNYILAEPNGSRYTRRNASLIESDWIKVPPKGKGVDRTFVPASWPKGSKVVNGWYEGTDANGHKIRVTFSYDVE